LYDVLSRESVKTPQFPAVAHHTLTLEEDTRDEDWAPSDDAKELELVPSDEPNTELLLSPEEAATKAMPLAS
jgi:hypothetical protein